MREKLNGNPMAQAGIVLVLLIAVGFMLLKGMGGEEEGEEAVPTEATVSVEGTGVSGTATAETPGAAVEGAIEAAAEGAQVSAVTSPLPAPPLPSAVTSAYDSGKTVVLLVVHDGGIDDRLAREAVEGLESMSDTAVFIVPVHQVARYAAITLGVDLNRVPALVVMRPKDLSEGTPEASITYGFQTPQSVEQAVLDARYDGPTVSYHPE